MLCELSTVIKMLPLEIILIISGWAVSHEYFQHFQHSSISLLVKCCFTYENNNNKEYFVSTQHTLEAL